MSGRNTIPVTVRQAREGEGKCMIQFWQDLGADASMYDHNASVKLDPNYLLVAVKEGEPVGFGGISEHVAGTYYLCFFIVREDLRNCGIGKQIWQELIKKAGDKNIALDGLAEVVPWYTKQGFLYQSFGFSFYQVTISEEMKGSTYVYQMKALTEELWPLVVKYDRQVYPTVDREKLLRAWYDRKEVKAVVAFDGDVVVGYGTIHRKSDKEYGLRNVFGDNETVVDAMIRWLFADVPVGCIVRMMKIDGKPLPECVKTATYSNMSAKRMYTANKLETHVEKMWFSAYTI